MDSAEIETPGAKLAYKEFLAGGMVDQNGPLFICFIEYEKNCDRVPLNTLFAILKELVVVNPIIKLVINLYENQDANIAQKE